MIKINRKTYRKRKIVWFEKLHEIREKEFRQRKKEFEFLKERDSLNMSLTRLRLIQAHTEYAIKESKADERDEQKLKEWKEANEENKKKTE